MLLIEPPHRPDLILTFIFIFTFMYTGMLLKAGPTDWIPQETKEIAEMNFRFIDKMDAASYVTRLANSMQISLPQHTVRLCCPGFIVIQLTLLSCHVNKYCTLTHSLTLTLIQAHTHSPPPVFSSPHFISNLILFFFFPSPSVGIRT
jgi:hypothetical protein